MSSYLIYIRIEDIDKTVDVWVPIRETSLTREIFAIELSPLDAAVFDANRTFSMVGKRRIADYRNA